MEALEADLQEVERKLERERTCVEVLEAELREAEQERERERVKLLKEQRRRVKALEAEWKLERKQNRVVFQEADALSARATAHVLEQDVARPDTELKAVRVEAQQQVWPPPGFQALKVKRSTCKNRWKLVSVPQDCMALRINLGPQKSFETRCLPSKLQGLRLKVDLAKAFGNAGPVLGHHAWRMSVALKYNQHGTWVILPRDPIA